MWRKFPAGPLNPRRGAVNPRRGAAQPARPGVKQTAWQTTPSPTSSDSEPAVVTSWAISR